MTNVKEQGGFKFKINEEGRTMIFDAIRNKFLVNTPEEWVRQNTVKYFHEELGFPLSLFVYNNSGEAKILIECKRPSIKITQSTFDQAFRYNLVLNIPYLVMTNGEELYCCRVDGDKVTFVKDIPSYQDLMNA